MFFSADILVLVLYCAQQLGVTLGVGAQTIMLVAYLSAMRDGVVDKQEAQFARAVRRVLNTGLLLIILSGVGITALHLMAGEAATILSAAYLFKWVLVFGVLIFTLLKSLPQNIMQGLAAGSWYALFIVHILAPVATWLNLLTLYGVWMVGFFLCWMALTYATKGKPSSTAALATVAKPTQPARVFIPPPLKPAPPPVAPAPPAGQAKLAPPPTLAPKPVTVPPPLKPVSPPPPPPKPAAVPPANLPVLPQQHILQTLPQPEVATLAGQAKVENKIKEEQNPWLPAIQIMPKTQGDADKQTKSATLPPQ